MHTKKPMANQIKRVICLALKELLKQNIILQKWPGRNVYTHAQVCVRRESTSGKRERESRRAEETSFLVFPPPVFRDENLNNRLSWALADTYLRIYLSSFF